MDSVLKNSYLSLNSAGVALFAASLRLFFASDMAFCMKKSCDIDELSPHGGAGWKKCRCGKVKDHLEGNKKELPAICIARYWN